MSKYIITPQLFFKVIMAFSKTEEAHEGLYIFDKMFIKIYIKEILKSSNQNIH